MIHIKYLIVYDACHYPYYSYSIDGISKRYKNLLKEIVLLKIQLLQVEL